MVSLDCFIRFDKTKQSKGLTVLTPGFWKMDFLNGNCSYWTSLKSFGWKEVFIPKPVHSQSSFKTGWKMRYWILGLMGNLLLFYFSKLFVKKKFLSSLFHCGNKYDTYGKRGYCSACIEKYSKYSKMNLL